MMAVAVPAPNPEINLNRHSACKERAKEKHSVGNHHHHQRHHHQQPGILSVMVSLRDKNKASNTPNP